MKTKALMKTKGLKKTKGQIKNKGLLEPTALRLQQMLQLIRGLHQWFSQQQFDQCNSVQASRCCILLQQLDTYDVSRRLSVVLFVYKQDSTCTVLWDDSHSLAQTKVLSGPAEGETFVIDLYLTVISNIELQCTCFENNCSRLLRFDSYNFRCTFHNLFSHINIFTITKSNKSNSQILQLVSELGQLNSI